MDRKPPLPKALVLELVDVAKPGGGPARMQGDTGSADAKGQRDLRMTTSDEFLSKAAAEYEKGLVDQALWRRAEDQCGDDASLLVAAYLRSRATSLQLQNNQDQPSQIQARGASSTRGATDPKVESDPREEIASTKFVGNRSRNPKPKLWQLAAIVAALVASVVAVYVMVSPPENESLKQPPASKAAPSPNQSAPSTPLISEQPVEKSAAGAANPASPEPALAVTVRQLKDTGKWQLLVLNATEWTRREPDNAAAWNELGFGYAKLGQFADALEAATRAVTLSPGNALFWRNLGRLNLDLDRLPEAGIAFAKALAVSPADADALCGAALVAQRQARSKDPDTTIKRVNASDGSCPDLGAGVGAAASAASSSTARKPASSVGR